MARGGAHGFLQKAHHVIRHGTADRKKILQPSLRAQSPRLNSAPEAYYATQIPGPMAMPMLGVKWQYLPGGPLHRLDKNDAAKKLNKKYGDIVLEKGGANDSKVYLFDPNHFAEVLRAEGDFPRRRIFNFLHKYNEKYNEGVQGLFTSHDFEWKRLRREVQEVIGNSRAVKEFAPDTVAIANDFVDRIAKAACPSGDVEDMRPEIKTYITEAAGNACFGLKPSHSGSFPEGEEYIEAAAKAMSLAKNGFRPLPLPAPTSKRSSTTDKKIQKVTSSCTEDVMERRKYWESGDKEKHLVGQLKCTYLSPREVTTLATEFYTSNVMFDCYLAYMLYALATNDRVQKTLYAELKDLSDDSLALNTLKAIPYFMAVEKEVLRMYPVLPGIERILHHDLVLGSYLIPAGTRVIMQYDLAGVDPRFIDNPEAFEPERWLENTDACGPCISPFLSMPFGHGPRACPASQLAFQQMGIAVTKVLQRFRIIYNGGELPIKRQVVNIPDGPLSFRVTERSCEF